MHVVIKLFCPSQPQIISFTNRKGLNRLKKFVPKQKSINEEVHKFQNTQ